MTSIYLDHNATTPVDPRVLVVALGAACEFAGESLAEEARRASRSAASPR